MLAGNGKMSPEEIDVVIDAAGLPVGSVDVRFQPYDSIEPELVEGAVRDVKTGVVPTSSAAIRSRARLRASFSRMFRRLTMMLFLPPLSCGSENSQRCPTKAFGSSMGVSDIALAGQNARTPPTRTSKPPRLNP